jgi:4-hydroxythreonine-4-phosphate dehydrogenase
VIGSGSPSPSGTGTPRRSLAITLGDPRGIGPEIAVAAAASIRSSHPGLELIFVGPEGTVADDAGPLVSIGSWKPAGGVRAAGRLAGLAIEAATRLALDGRVAGIVTAPIDKAALHAGGYDFPGHTEMFAALSGTPDVSMLMSAETTAIGGPLRVVLATTHVSLATVPRLVSKDLLVRQTDILVNALRIGWSLPMPRVALCALNPHASDGGLFGDEEERIFEPAVAELRGRGIDVRGPFPADTVFLRAARGEFDAVVAPYHDVGMAAFKTAAFGRGVNVTLGLPFVRTSPDHGTALDIAGRNLADPASMIEATQLADRLVAKRGEAAVGA